MPGFTSLNTRLSGLPLVICGPILRKTTANQVSVWIALKSARTLTLNVYVGNGGTVVATGTTTTTPLGTDLHVAVITAVPTGSPLTASVNYTYDIEFNNASTKLSTAGVISTDGSGIAPIIFQSSGFTRPSFSLPPTSLNNLRLVHASCRKPHGESKDAFEGLHDMIDQTFTNAQITNKADGRPHQLFLTGDQIYSDDVADSMLHMLRDAAAKLLTWSEAPPVAILATDLNPGKRASVVKEKAKFTPEDEACKSHLIMLGEFYCMYLFAFSPVLWDTNLPDWTDVIAAGGSPPSGEVFFNEQDRLVSFKNSLPKIRKALANVPVYMIFDDHEITDDLYLNKKWFSNVDAMPLGKRIIANGLTAYAVFQDWGNRPSFYNTGQPGGNLLAALGGGTMPSFNSIAGMVLPTWDNAQKRLKNPNGGMYWYYSIAMPNYEVLVLDCRTNRGFPFDDVDYPELISRNIMANQIPLLSNPAVEVTIVVSPGPVVGVPFVEGLKNLSRKSQSSIAGKDKEDWGFREHDTVQYFMGLLCKRCQGSPTNGRVVLLAGDVHYGFTTRTQMWATSPLLASAGNYNLIIAQLTASSLKNEVDSWSGSYVVHEHGYYPLGNLPSPVIKYGYQVPGSPPSRYIGNRATNRINVGTANPALYLKEHPSVKTPFAFNGIGQNGTFLAVGVVAPDWKYRVDYLMDTTGAASRPAGNPQVLNALTTTTKQTVLAGYVKHAANYQDYAKLHGNGKEIVGTNNIGEILFDWPATDANRKVIHRLWWRLLSKTNNPTGIQPLTRYEIPMGYNHPSHPTPPNP